MKKYMVISIISILGCFLASCEDNFLERTPKTEITDKDFFKTISDLQTYTNGFYTQLKYPYDDRGSDNISLNTGSNTINSMLIGNVSANNIDGWGKSDWENLRSINYFLMHISPNIIGDPADVRHYVGIAKFFRAYFYYEKVRKYSDVPWYNTALKDDDPDLYKACDPRSLVMDSIMRDLQYAVDNIKPEIGTRTCLSRYAALALMSRITLYEGTYRKYHSEVQLSDYERFLDKAIWASSEIMESGEFSIVGNSSVDYGALFSSEKLNNNKEIILVRESDFDLGIANNTHSVLGWQWSLSRSLMESFLMKDGTPFTSQPNYDTRTFVEVFKDRDPRLAETIAYPGFKTSETNEPYVPTALFGCYDQLKFYPKDENLRKGWGLNYTSVPIFRYAETLLVYAEALAEKGTLTQADLDKSVNLIKNRIRMPPLKIDSPIDTHLANYYPNINVKDKGTALEVRRERRVELACEGLRLDDVKRWGVGECLAVNPQGMYVPRLGAYDMTGDGKPDLAILASPSELEPISHLSKEEQDKLSKFYLKTSDGADEGFYLSKGTSGHIEFVADRKNIRKFISPKYYYQPIPQRQVQLNPNLKQPYGWDE